MATRKLKEPTYYNSRNIIDMADYVAFLAHAFCTATEKGHAQLCRKRQTSTFLITVRDDFISCDEALIAIGEIGRKVTESKTKSAIADSQLRHAACILRGSGYNDDPRIRNLMALENSK